MRHSVTPRGPDATPDRTSLCLDDFPGMIGTIGAAVDRHAAPNRREGFTMIRVTRILYPTDFSSYSNQAYFYAVGLAETYGASLTMVYVVTPGSGDAGKGRS